jgi:hypothetical protein
MVRHFPRRYLANITVAKEIFKQVVYTLQQQIAAFRDLSTSLAFDEAESAGKRR